MAVQGASADPEAATVEAAAHVRHAALFIVFVGVFQFLDNPLSALITLGIGAAIVGGAWLIARFQSRLAAAVILVAGVVLLMTRLFTGYRIVTGLLLMAAWVVFGAFALYATIRYHHTLQNSAGIR